MFPKKSPIRGPLLIVDKAFSFTQLGKTLSFPVISLVISIFSFGYYTKNRVTGMKEEDLEKVTGSMVKVINK